MEEKNLRPKRCTTDLPAQDFSHTSPEAKREVRGSVPTQLSYPYALPSGHPVLATVGDTGLEGPPTWILPTFPWLSPARLTKKSRTSRSYEHQYRVDA